MLIEMTEEALNNLILFLDRVPINGHKERYAMNEIESMLSNPIKDGEKNVTTADVSRATEQSTD